MELHQTSDTADLGRLIVTDSRSGPWEKREVSHDVFVRVFREAIKALEGAEVPYVLIGGIASACHGRPRWTRDIDVCVRPLDAEAALDALGRAGFETCRWNPYWIFKAVRSDVLVDVIFRLKGDIYLDDEVLAHAEREVFEGVDFPIVSAEDLVVIKAAVTSEECPHHWHDALGIIASRELDWDYLVRRARNSARRVLSLLVYAQSNDLVVPASAIGALNERLYA
jgi:predicted nucleotidyltransferase